MLDSLGLPHETQYAMASARREYGTLTDECFMTLYGSSAEKLNALVDAFDAAVKAGPGRGPEDEAIGLAFGFPQTNVEYYSGKRKRDPDKPDISIAPEEQKMFRFLSFSVERKDENAVNEAIETARRYSACVKALWPELHEEIMQFQF